MNKEEVYNHLMDYATKATSSTIKYGNKSYSDEPKNKLDAMKIKKVIANPKKDATTVIFKDGSVEVVKKSPDDNEADIYSVVAYAIAKHVYGSNSAFQKEVAKNIQFTKDKELNKLISKTSIGELNSALRDILNALKRRNNNGFRSICTDRRSGTDNERQQH